MHQMFPADWGDGYPNVSRRPGSISGQQTPSRVDYCPSPGLTRAAGLRRFRPFTRPLLNRWNPQRPFRRARDRGCRSSPGRRVRQVVEHNSGHREGDLRAAAERCQQHIDRQSKRTPVRQSRSAPGDGADPRPQILHRRAEWEASDIGRDRQLESEGHAPRL